MLGFKRMVRALHAAGLEVILDVVYNHTAEGNHLGPTLSLRGIDNATYYRLAEDRRHYVDFTGFGKTLNATQPQVLPLIMDSLRYWLNAAAEPRLFMIPPAEDRDWQLEIDTAVPDAPHALAEAQYQLDARSLVVLREIGPAAGGADAR